MTLQSYKSGACPPPPIHSWLLANFSCHSHAPIVLSLLLSAGPTNEGRKTVRQLRDIYWSMKDEIFGESQDGLLGFLAKGNTQKLEATLKGWLGEDVKLNQKTYPK